MTLDGSHVEPLDEDCFTVVDQITVELSGFTLIGGSHAGVYNAGNLALANSTVTNDGAWGIDNDGALTVINSTVFGNTGRAPIFNEGSVTLINSTVLREVASAALATGEFDDAKEYLTAPKGCVTRGSCALEQALISLGHNIESPNNTCGFGQVTDQVEVTPEQLSLGPLADNGGPTLTHALLTEPTVGVAIDAIPAEDCLDADGAPLTTAQRGEPRPEPGGTMCDVGAFEAQP